MEHSPRLGQVKIFYAHFLAISRLCSFLYVIQSICFYQFSVRPLSSMPVSRFCMVRLLPPALSLFSHWFWKWNNVFGWIAIALGIQSDQIQWFCAIYQKIFIAETGWSGIHAPNEGLGVCCEIGFVYVDQSFAFAIKYAFRPLSSKSFLAQPTCRGFLFMIWFILICLLIDVSFFICILCFCMIWCIFGACIILVK